MSEFVVVLKSGTETFSGIFEATGDIEAVRKATDALTESTGRQEFTLVSLAHMLPAPVAAEPAVPDALDIDAIVAAAVEKAVAAALAAIPVATIEPAGEWSTTTTSPVPVAGKKPASK